MRVHCKTAIAVTLAMTPTVGIAAPMSMLQSMPKSERSAPADPAAKPSRMGWLTKWFGSRPTPQPIAPAPAQASYPPTMAYQPAQPVPSAAPTADLLDSSPPAFETSAPTLSTPTITSVQPTAGAPAVGNVPAVPATSVKALREQGHAKDREGQLTAAENLYRQAIAIDPTSAAAVNDLGLCLARQGKLEPSVATLRQAITMRPDKPLYRNNIATVLVEVGKADEALAHLKTAYGPAVAHYNLGQLLTRTGRTDEAITQMNLALGSDPNLAPARDALSALTVSQEPTPVTPQPTTAPPTPAAEAPSYLTQTPTTVPAAKPPLPTLTPTTSPEPSYATAQIAAAPQHAEPAAEAPSGAPSFPRLLPPVLNR